MLEKCVHELGHDLGVWHSASRTCRQNGALVPLSDDCTIDEYGDPFDRWDTAAVATTRGTTRRSSAGSPESVGGSTVVLKDANTGKCMDVLGVSRDNGAKVVQWDCTGGANQKWDVVDAGDGAFSLRSVNSGKCLDVSGGNTGDNVPMVQWDCHGGTNQQFRKQ